MSDTKNNSVNALKSILKIRFNNFLKKRKHQEPELTLSHKNIYILPSKFGLAFVALNALIYILGINYQNNLVLFFSYLMLAFLLINFIVAFTNIYNLTVRIINTNPGYQHTGYKFYLQLSNTENTSSLQIEAGQVESKLIDLITEHPKKITINVAVNKRGKHFLPRIKLLSRYPFGLVTTWSYFMSERQEYIYPTPRAFSFHQVNTSDIESEIDAKATKSISENYQGVRPYQDGDKVNRISWKHYAKHQVLATKDFASGLSQEYVFTLNMVPGEIEQKLQHLSYLLTHAEQEQLVYSLVLPNTLIELGSGAQHFTQCLEALSDV